MIDILQCILASNSGYLSANDHKKASFLPVIEIFRLLRYSNDLSRGRLYFPLSDAFNSLISQSGYNSVSDIIFERVMSSRD